MNLHQMPGVGFRIGLCTFVCNALRDFAGLLSRDYLRGIRFPVAGCPIILFQTWAPWEPVLCPSCPTPPLLPESPLHERGLTLVLLGIWQHFGPKEKCKVLVLISSMHSDPDDSFASQVVSVLCFESKWKRISLGYLTWWITNRSLWDLEWW